MIEQYFDEQRRLGRYETMSGEHGFVRWATTTVVPEVVGFSSAVVTRHIAEAVFVAAADAPLAILVMYGMDPEHSIAAVFAQRGIPFRYAHGTGARIHRFELSPRSDEPVVLSSVTAA